MQDDYIYHQEPKPKFIEATMHDFKTHLSQYLMQLRLGNAQGIMVMKYRRPIAVVMDFNPKKQKYPRAPF